MRSRKTDVGARLNRASRRITRTSPADLPPGSITARHLKEGLGTLSSHGDTYHSLTYQQKSEKGAASGYASLTANTRVLEKIERIYSGTDATKPASPAVGDAYVATDTTKFYLCYSAGTWTLVGGVSIHDALTGLADDDHTLFGGVRNAAKYASIQAAIDDLPAGGGIVVIPPGSYSETFTITANKPILISARGAKLTLSASQTGVTINQGISTARGVVLEGLVVDGQSAASTVGIKVTDSCWPTIRNCQIENCATGVLIESNAAGNFSEGIALEDVVVRSCSGKGIHFSKVSGTGSFGQTRFRNVAVSYCGTDVYIDTGAQVYRSHLELQTWIDTNQTALYVDGDVALAQIELGIEGKSGATGNTGVTVAANATNTEHLVLSLHTAGDIATLISAGSKALRYMKNRAWFDVGGVVPLKLYKHGDSNPRLALETRNDGGYLGFGPGNTAEDVNLYRSAANVLKTDDKLKVATAPTESDDVVRKQELDAVGGGTEIKDADADTKIQTEEAADEDKLRFDTAGTERAVMDSTGLVLNVPLAVESALSGNYQLDLMSTARTSGMVYLGPGAKDVSGSWYGILFMPQSDFRLGTGAGLTGIYGNAAVNVISGAAGTSMRGLDFIAGVTTGGGGATVSSLIAQAVRCKISSFTGTVSSAIGVRVVNPYVSGGAPTITEHVGVDIQNAGGNANIATAIGLRIADVTLATTKYLIQAGPAANPWLQLLAGTPGANQTNLQLYEGSGPSLKRVQWKDYSNLASGDKVMVLV